jgi:hypothetical protein
MHVVAAKKGGDSTLDFLLHYYVEQMSITVVVCMIISQAVYEEELFEKAS